LNQADSLRAALSEASRGRPVLLSPRSRWLKAFATRKAKAEFASMLPGFRFLLAAIVLSMSILIFGLGAAALLRAAHEEFASNPFWRAAPETVFAQPAEATRPVLAMLRVDLPVAEKTTANVLPAAPPAAAQTDSAPPETAKAEVTIPESPAPGETAPAQRDASADATKIAAIEVAPSEHVSPPADQAAPIASERASAPAAPDDEIPSMKIAALDSPAVTIETQPPAKVASAKPDTSAIQKRQQARRAAQRRRVAQRARLAAQALQPLAADPFAQPPVAARKR
jgi:hypothetical protein